jgi:hypothetical protein
MKVKNLFEFFQMVVVMNYLVYQILDLKNGNFNQIQHLRCILLHKNNNLKKYSLVKINKLLGLIPKVIRYLYGKINNNILHILSLIKLSVR